MALNSRAQRTMLLGFVVSIAAAALIAIICLLGGSFGSFETKVLATSLLAAAASILSLGGVVCWERGRWPVLGAIGVLMAASAYVVTLPLIWDLLPAYSTWEEKRSLWRVVGTAWTLAVALPHAGLLSLAPLDRRYAWGFRWTALAIAATVCVIVYLVWSTDRYGDRIVAERVLPTLLILVACGTVAVPIFGRLSTIQRRDRVRTVELRVSLACPRCNLSQDVSVGRSACSRCRLRFSIELEEEQCPKCGYPLYHLESNICPECGTPFANPVVQT